MVSRTFLGTPPQLVDTCYLLIDMSRCPKRAGCTLGRDAHGLQQASLLWWRHLFHAELLKSRDRPHGQNIVLHGCFVCQNYIVQSLDFRTDT